MDADCEYEGPPRHYRRLVRRILAGGPPDGTRFDACRALLNEGESSELAFQALYMLLEGALSDRATSAEEMEVLIPLLKALGSGTLGVRDLL